MAHVTPLSARSGLHLLRMTAYTRAMSTTETTSIHAVPARRSILHPDVLNERSPFADWRGQASTEELPTLPHQAPPSASRAGARRASWRLHLRAALTGTLLAVVAVTGLSSYATQGVADARQNALCQAHILCR